MIAMFIALFLIFVTIAFGVFFFLILKKIIDKLLK